MNRRPHLELNDPSGTCCVGLLVGPGVFIQDPTVLNVQVQRLTFHLPSDSILGREMIDCHRWVAPFFPPHTQPALPARLKRVGQLTLPLKPSF